MGKAVANKMFAIDVVGQSRRALALAILASQIFGGETALAASPNLTATPTTIELKLRPPIPAAPVTEGYPRKWRSASAEMQADLDVLIACEADLGTCSPAARRLLAIIEAGREKRGRARIGIVNRAINLAIVGTSDMAQHGATDVWSSSLATFRSGKGDCEDYAIAKFAALLLAGVPAQDLRLVIVRNLGTLQAHAVLAAWLDDRWLVLDNRRFLLLDDRDIVNEYRPVLALTIAPAVSTYAQSAPRHHASPMPAKMLKR